MQLLWCQENKSLDVIWTDESSIQLETHRKFSYRKQGQAAKPKPGILIIKYYYCKIYI